MQGWLVPTVSLGYLLSLFAIAWMGDRMAVSASGGARRGRGGAALYAMTLLVYFTTWSFYGSVGRASGSGFDFASVYLGPTLVLLFGRPLLLKAIRVAKEQNVTSIADFIAARYGKSQSLAALVTIGATIALLPYISLQLRAVAATWDIVTGSVSPPWGDSALVVTVLMALFSILFGVRHIHASEHHRGLMLAIAFESVIKITVFLVAGIFIVFGLSGGFGAVVADIASQPALRHLAAPDLGQPSWWSNLVLSAIAFICLPHMFHVAVVENDDPAHLGQARWVMPGYMLLLSLFIVPIAAIGLSRLSPSIDPDVYMMALPLAERRSDMALLVFIGGLSAATGMVVVAAVSLSTMVCNDLVMPLLLRRPSRWMLPGEDLSRPLLVIRRVAVAVVLLLAYLTFRLIDRSHGLVTVGLLSFVAVAQFGPAFVGGLFWRRGSRAGALGGISAGFAIWLYTLLLPSLFSVSTIPEWVASGPFGLHWLRPHALFGWGGLDPISHATVWSLAVNLTLFVVLSLYWRPRAIDRAQASAFVNSAMDLADIGSRAGAARVSLGRLQAIAERYLGCQRAAEAFRQASPVAGPEAIHFTERLLAGAIGAASARVVIAASLQGERPSAETAKGILDEANLAIQFNRDLLAATLENIGQGICVFDRDLRIATWNNRFLALCNLPEDVVHVGLPLRELVRFNLGRGEYRSEDLDNLIANRDIAKTRWPYVYERHRPDGTVLEVCFTRMPDGGLVATYTDVTERHHAARLLEQANAGLEQRVAERTQALSQAKAEAERANLGKTRFVAAASHDLLQPLNASRLFLAALQDRLAAPSHDRDEERRLLAGAAQALGSVEQLLGTLLDISAIDSGAVRPEVIDFPIDAILSRLTAEFAKVAHQRGLELRTRSCGATVRSDPALLRRILQNFLSNALRYTGTGGILLACRGRGDHLRIEVWDTGPGIPLDRQSEVFQEFRRLDNGVGDGQERGLGLGLAIVDRLCRKLNHPIHLCSRPGHGTLFAVTVPLGATGSDLAAEPERPQADPIAGLPVLCIDNEETVRHGLAALLRGWGCQVWMSDGRGEIMPAEARPAAVIVDYHLGDGVNGLALVEVLRRSRSMKAAVLLVTADRSEAVKSEARRQGVEVLYKPVRPAALRTWLGQAARARCRL